MRRAESIVTLEDVVEIIEGRVISEDVDLTERVDMACGADLMSDVLAFTHAGTLLLTGLTNPQVGIRAILFVRGKYPPPETVSLAKQKGIPLFASRFTLYETCGRLYQAGLPSCGLFEVADDSWQDDSGARLAP
jgi:predicted transcriptional regulator